MTQAGILVRRIASDLKNTEQALRPHPYARACRDGSASLEALVPFVGAQYHMFRATPPAQAAALRRHDDDIKSGFMRGFLESGQASRTKIPVMAAQIGLSEADLLAYEPSAESVAYGAFLSALLAQGTAAEIMCGLLVNLPAWRFNCAEIGQGLRENYAWPEDATAYVDGAAAIPALDDEALPIIQAGLDQGEDPRDIARVARLIQGYEKMFWDAVAAEAGRALSDNQEARRISA